MSDNTFAPKWKRNAAFFLGGQFLSTFGSMLVSFSVTWHITLQEQSGGLVALFACASMLPMVLISPFAGVWADRYNRKILVNLADSAIALITLLIAVLYITGHKSIWLLFAATMARSMGQGVQMPAVNALIPQLVPEDKLAKFNGIQSTAHSLTTFASPMAAGALLSFLPIEKIFFIDVATAVVGIATVFIFVKVAPVPVKKDRQTGAQAYWHEMKEGIRFISSQSWLKTMLVFTALFCFLAAPVAMLTPLQVARSFGGDVWRLTAIELTWSGGMVVGGIAISLWGGFQNKVHSMILAWILFGVSTVLFGVLTNFWVYLGVMVFCGMVMPLYNTPSMTLMQSKIPPEVMGRVFSALAMINGVAMPLGSVLFGPIGDVVAIEWLLVITGALMVVGGLVLLRRKTLIAAGAPD